MTDAIADWMTYETKLCVYRVYVKRFELRLTTKLGDHEMRTKKAEIRHNHEKHTNMFAIRMHMGRKSRVIPISVPSQRISKIYC
jgi:hypothetical protein